MIAVIRHGEVAPEKAGGYLDYRPTDGNRGVYVLGKIGEERARSLASSFWGAMRTFRGFVGADPEGVGYWPGDGRYRLHSGPTVGHCGAVTGRGSRVEPGGAGRGAVGGWVF